MYIYIYIYRERERERLYLHQTTRSAAGAEDYAPEIRNHKSETVE